MCICHVLELSYSGVISGVGLLCDMLAVWFIFINPGKAYNQLDKKRLPKKKKVSHLFNGRKSDSPTYEEVNSLIEKLADQYNKDIDDVNLINDEIYKSNKKWMYLLVFGFFLQLVATYITI